MKKNSKILVTGAAGFIGMHLCKAILSKGYEVFGIDNMNDYYDPKIKDDRLKLLNNFDAFNFKKIDISNMNDLNIIFKRFNPHKVVNLAAQAGVRYSIVNPHAYITSNIKGFMNILECVRNYEVNGLIYASSSSVYGKNKLPFSIENKVSTPTSIYAATKRANELMAHSYSHLYNIPTTGLRFFTVYGPWGRPDMAFNIFSDKILKKQKLPVFNNGNMFRDFTYIDDIIGGIESALEHNYECEIFNLGNNVKVGLHDLINLLQEEFNQKIELEHKGMQLGDVPETLSDIEYSKRKLNYNPKTSINDGVSSFVKWYKEYYIV